MLVPRLPIQVPTLVKNSPIELTAFNIQLPILSFKFTRKLYTFVKPDVIALITSVKPCAIQEKTPLILKS